MTRHRDRLALLALLAFTFGVRAWNVDQPIVENYVGRQIPTAMVARNIERGSGFLRPQLETGPFPNLFLVEPPIYASLVAEVTRVTGWPIGVSGRLVSALATTLGAWGLYGLTRRREGVGVALLAVGAFAMMPVMIRYGRAVQPDALMLGTQLAALRCWDAFAHEDQGRRGWILGGWLLLATSLAVKVTSAFVFMPLIAILGPKSRRAIGLAILALAPAILWYVHASVLLAEGKGSRASLDNRRIWLDALVPTVLFDPETYRPAARYLLIRSFTPIGLVLAMVGVFKVRPIDRLWWIWGASALLALVLLAGKWHHEYYWMVLAPVLSVGIARSLLALARAQGGRRWAAVFGAVFVGMAAIGSSSTWRTPAEWQALDEAAEEIRRVVPADRWLVAPEALLYASDRRGCRLETTPRSAQRAAGEWGGRLGMPDDPLALVEFYRSRGAAFLADLVPEDADGSEPRLALLRRLAREQYHVLIDRPDVFVVELVPKPGLDGASDGH
ncbi:ArnT family glycosyltransferase [Tautonia rosea]|uniref:ArnT family glycosyltransferase n=1 Tax=Tautonia rosea TaxID=2728037 RepID=UPI0014735B7B|nr:glycosyltransferase family 39 protein [Tautonia rosea]